MGIIARRGCACFGEFAAMNQIEALSQIDKLGTLGFETRDISALLRVSPANASMLLKRLAISGFVYRVARGRWVRANQENRERLVEQLAAPYPACISLQSALFLHGLIEQVPAVIYAVTPGRARRFDTPLGSVSLHRIPPELFGGFKISNDGTKIATAEKALFDLLYLSPTRSRLFASLPELEVPKAFRWSEVRRWIEKIAAKNRRSFVERKAAVLKAA